MNTAKQSFPIYSIIKYFEYLSYTNPEIKPNHRSLYYFILHTCIKKLPSRRFNFAKSLGMEGSKITNKNTYYQCLQDLEKLNLIKYYGGKNRFDISTIEVLFDTATSHIPAEYRYQFDTAIGDAIGDAIAPYNKLNKIEANKLNVPFDLFWQIYDKNIKKEDCETVWQSLKDEQRLAIIEYLPRYKQAEPDKKYRKNPLNFLNEKTWLDEIIDSLPGKGAKVVELYDREIHAPFGHKKLVI